MENNLQPEPTELIPTPPLQPIAPIITTEVATETKSQENIQPSKNKTVLLIVIALVFLFLLAIGGVYLYSNFSRQPTTINTVDLHTDNLSATPLFEVPLINSEIFEHSEPSIIATIPVIGEIKKDETISLKHNIDENVDVIFYLVSEANIVSFELVSPRGTTINEDYSKINSTLVTFESNSGGAELPPAKIYEVKNAEVGEWTINLKAGDATSYKVFAIFSKGMATQSAFDKHIYKVGDNMIIATQFKDAKNLSDVKVIANIQRPDEIIDKVELTKNSNNIYVGVYTIPSISGYITADIEARGNHNGHLFTRNNILLASINAELVTLTDVYSEKAIDIDNDGLYDQIDFKFEVDVKTETECSIQADLYVGSEQITHDAEFIKLVPGKQFVTLSFDGESINRNAKDGPYNIKRIFITPIETGITADSRNESVLTTTSYRYSQFEVSR